MRIEWTQAALADIADAGDWIALDNPDAAERMAGRVREAVEVLVDFPASGRPGRLRDTREIVVSGTPFIVIYQVRSDVLQILRLLHHARRWP